MSNKTKIKKDTSTIEFNKRLVECDCYSVAYDTFISNLGAMVGRVFPASSLTLISRKGRGCIATPIDACWGFENAYPLTEKSPDIRCIMDHVGEDSRYTVEVITTKDFGDCIEIYMQDKDVSYCLLTSKTYRDSVNYDPRSNNNKKLTYDSDREECTSCNVDKKAFCTTLRERIEQSLDTTIGGITVLKETGRDHYARVDSFDFTSAFDLIERLNLMQSGRIEVSPLRQGPFGPCIVILSEEQSNFYVMRTETLANMNLPL